MPLTASDVGRLATEISQQLDFAAVELLASDLGVQNDLQPGGTLKERAFRLIARLNGNIPPRDRELLERFRSGANARLRQVATDLLRPSFISPTGKPLDAVLLGRAAFIARPNLRQLLDQEFTDPKPSTTHVLIVQGGQDPSGKSYSYSFLQHLAFEAVNAQATRLSAIKILSGFELLVRTLQQLGLAAAALVSPVDSPQSARTVDSLIPAFKAQIRLLATPIWLVLDDLNDPSVKPEVREAAFAMAKAIEEEKPPFLWIVLLGYNDEIIDDTLRFAAIEDAQFFTSTLAANFLDVVATASAVTLPANRSQQMADLLFDKYHADKSQPFRDKVAMKSLTTDLERTAAKLRLGLQP
jgi:hypothetical protein